MTFTLQPSWFKNTVIGFVLIPSLWIIFVSDNDFRISRIKSIWVSLKFYIDDLYFAICVVPSAHAPPERRAVEVEFSLGQNKAKCLRTLIKERTRSLLGRLRLWTSRRRCQTQPWFCLNSSITPWTFLSPHLEVTGANRANWANMLAQQHGAYQELSVLCRYIVGLFKLYNVAMTVASLLNNTAN